MKRLIILLIGLFFIVSCCSVRPGKLTGKWFRSTTCVDDARTPGLYVYFYPDGGFLYQMAYADGATGAWRIEGDTVILWSRISVSCWIVFCCRTAHAVGLI